MKNLITNIKNENGELIIFTADKIVKDEVKKTIIGVSNDSEVFAFRGINNFGSFQLANGQQWDIE